MNRHRMIVAPLRSRALLSSIAIHSVLMSLVLVVLWLRAHPIDSAIVVRFTASPIEKELQCLPEEGDITEPLPSPEMTEDLDLVGSDPVIPKPERSVPLERWDEVIDPVDCVERTPVTISNADWRRSIRPVVEPRLPMVIAAPAVNASTSKAIVLAELNDPPRYPLRAVRLHLEGRVVVKVQVDVGGRVVRCWVWLSSGSALLDDAALCAVRGWRFENGPGLAQVPVLFRLRGRGP